MLRRSARWVAGLPWAMLFLATAYTAGWGLITWGLARLTIVEVWLFSAGLYLLSLGGLGLLKDVAVEGLYVLSRSNVEGSDA